MRITTISGRSFNQDTGHAKRAAKDGPVFITDRGKPSHVLMSMTDYLALTNNHMSLADAVAQADTPDVDFEPARLGEIARPADLS